MTFAFIQKISPVTYAFILALLITGVTGVLHLWSDDIADAVVLQKSLLLFGGVLLFHGVLDAASIARREAGAWSLPGLHYTFAMATYWGSLVAVLLWPSEGGGVVAHAATWLASGVIFGLIMNVWFSDKQVTPALEAFYDTAKPATATPIGRAVFWGMHIVPAAIVIAMMLFPPEGGWAFGTFWFVTLAVFSMNAIYWPKADGVNLWPHLPRIVGVAALLAGWMFF